MKSPYDIILKPIITERSMEKVADKKYVFEVARDANKIEVRDAVEKIFGVKVMSVNTMNVRGKEKTHGRARRPPSLVEKSHRPAQGRFQDH